MYKTIATILVLLSKVCLANVAEPGIWSSGGVANYALLFPEDSACFQRVQMEREKVMIHLYRGFAVVKGVYWMRNSSKDTIRMKAGYPVNSAYTDHMNRGRLTVNFDDLCKLEVESNGTLCNYTKTRQKNAGNGPDVEWYVWQNFFLPDTLTKIEIRFIVKTNDAKMRDGYSINSDNVFVYLLESGAAWKQPIGEGEIIIELKDNIAPDEIRGISSGKQDFFLDEGKNILYYHFLNLTPHRDSSNIIIAYGKQNHFLDFENITRNSDKYFMDLEQLEQTSLSTLTGKPFYPGNPFDFGSEWSNPFLSLSLLLVGGIAGIILLILFATGIFKRKKET